MKLYRWMPVLVVLVGAKLFCTAILLYLYQTGAFLFEPKEALARAPQGQKEPVLTCPKELFTALRVERERLKQEALELEKKKQELALLEEQLTKRLASLATLEEEIDKKLRELRIIRSERFKLLVGAYTNMKPSKVAKLLEAMEPEMAIKILSVLKTDQVARILSAMPPEKAAALSVDLRWRGFPSG
jgi:flagellar motility protein MotE (MotC chaperone)